MKSTLLCFILALPMLLYSQKQAFDSYIIAENKSLSPYDFIQVEDRLYAAFNTRDNMGEEFVSIVALDTSGQLLWSRELSDAELLRRPQLYASPEGHIDCFSQSFGTSFRNTDIAWVRFDKEGQLLAQKIIGSDEAEDVDDVYYHQNGKMVLTGAVSQPGGIYDLFLQDVESDGSLGNTVSLKAGIYNYPSNLIQVGDQYVVSLRWTIDSNLLNQAALIWLDSVFNVMESASFSMGSSNVHGGPIVYDKHKKETYLFIETNLNGFVVLDDQHEISRKGAFQIGDVDEAFLHEGHVNILTSSGEMGQIAGDSLSGRVYNMRTDYSGINFLTYDMSINSLFGLGFFTESGSNTRRGVFAKNMPVRNMACGSSSSTAGSNPDLEISKDEVTFLPTNAQFQMIDYTFNWNTADYSIHDSCRISCQALNTDFSYTKDMFTVDLTVLEPDSTADYEWAFSDGGKAFGEMTTYQFPQEGMYEVCLYGYNYCGSDTICQEIEIGGSSIDQQEESSIRLFPNPASDYFQLQLPVALDELQLYDLYGRQQFVSFNAKGRVDVSSLNRGIYFIQYRLQDGKRGSLRVTVQ